MGIDLDKMRQKHSALTTKGGGGNNDTFWKPEEGINNIRIVCPKNGDPFRDYLFHYRMGADGNTTMISPRTFGRTDPIAEFGNQLWNEGTEASKQEARGFFPRMRVFAPVVVRGEEEKGVRLWGFSKTTYESLLNIVLDPEYGDITDPHTGTDLRLEYGKKAGQMYPTTDIRPFRKASKLAKTDEEIDTLLSSMPNFEEVFPETTTEAAQLLLDQTLNSSSEDTGEGTVKYGNQNATTSNETSTDGTDIDQAFNDLLA